MNSKPRRELALGLAFCSPWKVGVSFNNTDASHPFKNIAIYKKNIYRNNFYFSISYHTTDYFLFNASTFLKFQFFLLKVYFPTMLFITKF